MNTIRTGMLAYQGIAAAVQREREAQLSFAAGMTACCPDTLALEQRDTAPQAYACVATGPYGTEHQTLRERAPVKVTRIERFHPKAGRVSFMYEV